MLKLRIICVGKQKDSWMREGTQEYSKRMGSFCSLEWIELDEYRLPENPSNNEIEKALTSEGKEILKRVQGNSLIALCIEGKEMSSVELSKTISHLSQTDSTLCFVIGSSFGLSDEVKDRANLKLSFSRLTFPHQLMRLILSEQLYRALSILNGLKYHK